MDQAPTNPFVHHGRIGQLSRVALVNGLLNLVTLSWYRFWGNTRVRRLLWNHTTAWGDPLEYTGTGKELFLGFLIVFFLVLVPLMLTGVAVNALATAGNPLAILGVVGMQAVVLFLAGAGLYRARSYRLSRTVWRGIRGGQDGSAWRYGAMFVLSLFASAVTWGWAWPATELWLQRYKLANTRVGSVSLDCTATPGKLYKTFALCWILGAVLALVAALGVPFLLYALGQLSPEVEQQPESGYVLAGVTIVAALAVALLLPFAIYRAAFWRHVAANTRFDGASFAFTPTIGGMLGLGIGNWLLTTATLGLLAPLAALRTFRFACTHLGVTGQPDFAVIAQGAAAEGSTGEGLAAMFDGAGAL